MHVAEFFAAEGSFFVRFVFFVLVVFPVFAYTWFTSKFSIVFFSSAMN